MADEYWTLEAFENAGTRELELEGKKLKIKAVDPKLLIVLFDGQDVAGLQDGSKAMSTADLLKNLDLLDEVVVAGLVEPKVTKETVHKLGRFKQRIAQEVMEFSGLGEKEAKTVEKFRAEPDG